MCWITPAPEEKDKSNKKKGTRPQLHAAACWTIRKVPSATRMITTSHRRIKNSHRVSPREANKIAREHLEDWAMPPEQGEDRDGRIE